MFPAAMKEMKEEYSRQPLHLERHQSEARQVEMEKHLDDFHRPHYQHERQRHRHAVKQPIPLIIKSVSHQAEKLQLISLELIMNVFQLFVSGSDFFLEAFLISKEAFGYLGVADSENLGGEDSSIQGVVHSHGSHGYS